MTFPSYRCPSSVHCVGSTSSQSIEVEEYSVESVQKTLLLTHWVDVLASTGARAEKIERKARASTGIAIA